MKEPLSIHNKLLSYILTVNFPKEYDCYEGAILDSL